MNRKLKLLRQLAACFVCLLLAGVLTLLRLRLADSIEGQTAAERWRAASETRYAQVSCFLDTGVGFDEAGVMRTRQAIADGLAGQTEATWTTGYSAVSTAQVAAEGTSVTARAIVTGGDFFAFHPLDMISGSTYSEAEVNRDGVVLDMALAWKLFGGYALEGMELTVGGLPVTITGVARSPQSGLMGDAYGTEPTIWLSASLMDRLGGSPSVTCFEAALPDPVTGFAKDTLKTAMSVSEGSSEFLVNTGRFSFLTSLKNVWNTGERTVRTSRVLYPYWENAARVAESRCALYAALCALFLLYPALYVLYRLIRCAVLLDRRFQSWRRARKSYR